MVCRVPFSQFLVFVLFVFFSFVPLRTSVSGLCSLFCCFLVRRTCFLRHSFLARPIWLVGRLRRSNSRLCGMGRIGIVLCVCLKLFRSPRMEESRKNNFS